MSNDLISRSELIKTIKSTDTTYNPHFAILLNSLVNLVNEQPAAYDVDGVLDELLQNSEQIDELQEFTTKKLTLLNRRMIDLRKAVDIVQRDGR